MTTTESNKLIAEFMGFGIDGKFAYIPDEGNPLEENMLIVEMKYHTSWDWLMPVVSKITRDEMLIGNEYRESIMDTVPYGLIEDTYQAVIQFIKSNNNL